MPAPTDEPGALTLVAGAAGMLGRALCAELRRSARPFIAVDLPDLDITDPRAVDIALHDGVRLVINAAAYTDVDRAESEEHLAHAVNAIGPQNLAARCARTGATLVHVSTDYVFDGAASSPYRTNHPRRPAGAYARSKADGEERIEQSGADFLIVRTSWLYAPWGRNFVRTIAKLARERDELRVVNDQTGRPSSAEGVAHTILRLLAARARGVRHATDAGACTWFEFARRIVREIGAPCVVTPCTTAEYPRPARRPAYSVLDLSETEAALGPMTPWETALADVVRRMETP
jgi:dTDP-4-dehydrorhamnose reductase